MIEIMRDILKNEDATESDFDGGAFAQYAHRSNPFFPT